MDKTAEMHLALRQRGWEPELRSQDEGGASWRWKHPSQGELKGHQFITWKDGGWKHHKPSRVGLNHVHTGLPHEDFNEYLRKTHTEAEFWDAEHDRQMRRRFGPAKEAIVQGADVEQVIEATFHTGVQSVVARDVRRSVHSNGSYRGVAATGYHGGGYSVPQAQIHRQRVKARRAKRPTVKSGRQGRARLYYADRLI
jgi:hypothetical protein